MKAIVIIALVFIVAYAFLRLCWRQIKRVQAAKQYVSEAYRKWLLERPESCEEDETKTWPGDGLNIERRL